MIALELLDGELWLSCGPLRAVLRVSRRRDDSWEPMPMLRRGDEFAAAAEGIEVRLRVQRESEWLRYELEFKSARPTRLQLALALPDAAGAFHIIPACIFGDNGLAHSEPGHVPNLTTRHAGNVSCSPHWELRADRASHPVSLVCFDGGLAGVSIAPYSRCDSADGFMRNGLFAQVAHEEAPDACGATLGYGNLPCTFSNKDDWAEPTCHETVAASARGCIFLEVADSRLAAHGIIRRLYAGLRETPESPISVREAAEALTNAFLTVNWQEDQENFANMHTLADPERKRLAPWRTLAEVGWSGGGVIGYPLIAAGHALEEVQAGRRGRYKIDWVARAFNPASGLLWDVCGKHEGKQVDWWWSGYLVKGVHCAYTNGSGLYYLLKSYRFCRETLGEEHPEWLATALKALDTIVALQRPDGNFGYTYSAERPEMLDPDGFAGVWFAPALVLAHRFTGRRAYLDAARRAMEFYHAFVRDLNCWGTPMDTFKVNDQEGNLGFIRGAALLHEALGDGRCLAMLTDAAHYEYLWRYGFRARPEAPPLKGSHWNSCGGSVTSVSNPHIHPMGVYVARELRLLAELTGDPYHAQRAEDGVNWGVNCVSLYPEVSGYGEPGVLTERFCPSDGLLIESFPDGSPSSIWFSYNGWAAAAVLEGLIEWLQ